MEKYDEALRMARALIEGEPEDVPNMANLSALVFETLADVNWAGFYTVTAAGGLLLGPFQGKPACIRIARGKGVCGTALETGKTQWVPDVHAFPGHIACDSASRSEVVVSVFRAGKVVAVLDVDSPVRDRFTADEVRFLEGIAGLFGEHGKEA